MTLFPSFGRPLSIDGAHLNLEGVVWRADGRMVVINDSQSGGEIVAQSQLLLFKAPMGQAAKALAAPR